VRTGLLRPELIAVTEDHCVAGRARTALCGQGDNLAVHRVMELVQPGDGVVLAMPETRPTALAGDLLAPQAKVRGAAALLVDAAVQDRDEIAAMGLAVWARWVHARGAETCDPGALGCPVTVGGVEIADGDVVVLDADAVVVVPATTVEATLAASESSFRKEEGLRGRLEAGDLTLDLMSLRPEAVK